MAKEIFNHERIMLDEFIDEHGAETVIKEIKSIFEEKMHDKKRSFNEREYMIHFVKNSIHDHLESLVLGLYNLYGGGPILRVLKSLVKDYEEHCEEPITKKRYAKQVHSLEMKTIRDAWGLK